MQAKSGTRMSLGGPASITGMVLAILLLGAGTGVQGKESDARSILKAMSDYVSSQNTIQLTFDSDIEVITPELEKIQFTNSGEALLSRPDKLRAHRIGGYSDVALVFDGKTVGSGDCAPVASRHARGAS